MCSSTRSCWSSYMCVHNHSYWGLMEGKETAQSEPQEWLSKAILYRQRYSCWGRKTNIYAALPLTKSLNSEGPHCVEARLRKISLILYRFSYCTYQWSIWEPFRNTLSHMPNSCHVQFILTFLLKELHIKWSFCLHTTCASFNLTSLWFVSTCMGTDPRSTSKR